MRGFQLNIVYFIFYVCNYVELLEGDTSLSFVIKFVYKFEPYYYYFFLQIIDRNNLHLAIVAFSYTFKSVIVSKISLSLYYILLE